jgi:hypothetical protein
MIKIMKKGGYIFLFFVLLHFSCKFVPYFAPAGAILNIYSDRSQIETGGDKAIITILGFTAEGAPLRDYTRVLLSASIGTVPPYVDLVDGKAVTEFVSGTQRGQASISAQSGEVKSEALIIQVGPGDLSYLNIEADPAHLDPGGGRSKITVYAYDSDNRPLPGILVQLTTDNGYFENGSNSLQTDANGMCRDWLVTEKTALVKAGSGTESKTITVFVDTNTNPTAKFFYTPKAPKGNENVFFNASESSDADGSIVAYEWNFGDGARTSGEIVSHNYNWRGTADKTFFVVLQVTDDQGATATATQEVTVKGNLSPTAKFFYTPKTPKGNEDVFFNASESSDADGYIVAYDWYFGDGTTGTGVTITHNYNWSGTTAKTYTVILQVTDNSGAIASSTLEVTVTPNV